MADDRTENLLTFQEQRNELRSRREADAKIGRLEQDVSGMRADIAGLASAVQHTSTSIDDLKNLVLQEKSRPVNVVGWVTTALVLISMQGGQLAFVLSQINKTDDAVQAEVSRTNDRFAQLGEMAIENAYEQGRIAERSENTEYRIRMLEKHRAQDWRDEKRDQAE